MAEKTYKSEVVDSSKELTAKERIQLKDLTDGTNLNELVSSAGHVDISIDFTATVEVHNEKAEHKDYTVYVYMDKDGTKYYSGSETLANRISEIADELADDGISISDEGIILQVYGRDSKNFAGRQFLTAKLL